MSAADRVKAMAGKKRESDSFRLMYEICKEVLLDEGWSEEDLKELHDSLMLDMGSGPGADRPFPMTGEERRECWKNWMAEKIGTSANAKGVTERIRASIQQKQKEQNSIVQ